MLVDGADVTRMQPTILVDSSSCRLGHLVVALHDVVAATAVLARHAWRAVLAGLRVDDAHLDLVVLASDGLALALERVVRRGLREHRAGLGEPVADGHLGSVHLVDDLLHRLDRARRTGHDSGAQAREVEHVEHRMRELRNEHRRHAVECGRALLLHCRQHDDRIETLDHDHRRAVCKHGEHTEHAPETVEERHRQAHAVLGGELLALADVEAVVEDVRAREHNALGEAGRARRVLHVDDVVGV
ncbi:MAG: hypothetical protein FD127_4282 [Acidimicrobiaceae bacterium]|nr:MAG: hypothetical protein FD127_4282 [Acidimicrobiaceae bacterium]